MIALGGGSFAVLAVGEIFAQTTDFTWFYGFLIGLAVIVMAFAAFLPSMKNSVEGAAPVSGSAE